MKSAKKISFLMVSSLWLSFSTDAMNSNLVFNDQEVQSSSVRRRISDQENIDPNDYRPTVKAYDGPNRNPLLNFTMTEAEKIQGNPDNIAYHLVNKKKPFTQNDMWEVVEERISKDGIPYDASKILEITNIVAAAARCIGNKPNGNRLYWAKIQNHQKYSKNFLHPIICCSVSEKWESAAQEWEIIGYERVEKDTCICGKEEIKDIYTIRNRCNGNELYPIGSRCINKFKSEKMNEDINVYKKVSDKIFNGISRLRETVDRGESIKFNIRLFSKEFIRYLNIKRVLIDSDYQFLLEMLRKRYKRSGEREQINNIIEDFIVPYVRELPRDVKITVDSQMLE